jgi:prepilin-type N-terminal cleavage/methylation domain-containing protein
MVRSRRHSGFTLVELLIVVALIAITGMLAARLYSRGVRGEAAPSFTRSLMSTVLDARHAALTLGRPTRLTLNPTPTTASTRMAVTTDVYDPPSSTWITQSTIWVPAGLQLCKPDSSGLGAVTPVCPLTTGVDNLICFSPNGHVNLAGASTTCSTSNATSFTNANLYVGSQDGAKKYRIVIWGLTGMAKLLDQW